MKFLDRQRMLAMREQAGLMRHRLTLDGAQQIHCTIDNQSFVNFASNNYLGLANSAAAKAALIEASEHYGFGSGASHLVCGHQQPHDDLEKALAEFVGRDAALTFSSGYMANLAILQSLASKGDLIVADKLNHASLVDGARLSPADFQRYPHCDLSALEKRLKKAPQNKFVVTDGVFSMDGDIAPLVEISGLCEKYQAILIVDDAHGFGVLGEHGKGSSELFDLDQEKLPVLMGTLGKALGGVGAFIAGEKHLVDYLLQFARSYIYTTAMPAANAAANLANLRVLQDSPQLLKKLAQNIQYFRHQCTRTAIDLLPSNTAIQPLLIGDNQQLLKVNQSLMAEGFLVGAIRPPTVPLNSARLRVTLSAAHNENDINQLIGALKRALTL